MRLSRRLYRAPRLSRDLEAIERTAETGNPPYAARRAKNKVLGRTLAPLGIWRRLWR